MTTPDFPLWEVFVRAKGGLSHRHVGSVHAADALRAATVGGAKADARMALESARDVYTRRMEGVSLWVVPSTSIVASDPGESASLFGPAEDKVYRHPTFYIVPDNVKHI